MLDVTTVKPECWRCGAPTNGAPGEDPHWHDGDTKVCPDLVKRRGTEPVWDIGRLMEDAEQRARDAYADGMQWVCGLLGHPVVNPGDPACACGEETASG